MMAWACAVVSVEFAEREKNGYKVTGKSAPVIKLMKSKWLEQQGSKHSKTNPQWTTSRGTFYHSSHSLLSYTSQTRRMGSMYEFIKEAII